MNNRSILAFTGASIAMFAGCSTTTVDQAANVASPTSVAAASGGTAAVISALSDAAPTSGSVSPTGDIAGTDGGSDDRHPASAEGCLTEAPFPGTIFQNSIYFVDYVSARQTGLLKASSEFPVITAENEGEHFDAVKAFFDTIVAAPPSLGRTYSSNLSTEAPLFGTVDIRCAIFGPFNSGELVAVVAGARPTKDDDLIVTEIDGYVIIDQHDTSNPGTTSEPNPAAADMLRRFTGMDAFAGSVTYDFDGQRAVGFALTHSDSGLAAVVVWQRPDLSDDELSQAVDTALAESKLDYTLDVESASVAVADHVAIVTMSFEDIARVWDLHTNGSSDPLFGRKDIDFYEHD